MNNNNKQKVIGRLLNIRQQLSEVITLIDGKSLASVDAPRIQDVVFDATLKSLHIDAEGLLSPNRSMMYVAARCLIAHWLRPYMSLNHIGRVLYRDHSSVSHMIDKYDSFILTYEWFRKADEFVMNEVEKLIK